LSPQALSNDSLVCVAEGEIYRVEQIDEPNHQAIGRSIETRHQFWFTFWSLIPMIKDRLE
jgi:hypothetical protein